MSSIKTTISVRKTLFEEAEALARQLGVSRSRLFSLALEEFVRRHENRRLFEQFNAAYADGLDAEEQATLDAALDAFDEIADKW